MIVLQRMRQLLRAVFFRRRLDRDMREEMDAHLLRSVERLMQRGLSAEDARHAARREFGNLAELHEQGRDAWGARWIESTVGDVRHATRQWGRRPFTTLTMILLLALGIGANTALFTVLYAWLSVPPAGIPRAESLVRIRGIERLAVGRNVAREFSYPEYREYAAQRTHFSDVTAWCVSDVILTVGGDRANLHTARAHYVTGNYFRVLGVRPSLGVGLPAATADTASPQLIALISHAAWIRFFGGAPDVLGKTLAVNDVLVTVVGVAPRTFVGAVAGRPQIALWLPLNARAAIQRSMLPIASHDTAFLGVAARLDPEVAIDETLPVVRVIADRSASQRSDRGDATVPTADVVPMTADNHVPPSGEAPNLLSRAMTFFFPLVVLLIPCMHVGALLIGLAVARRREIAVRLALGAARRRIIRQLLTESVLMALVAGAVALGVIGVLLRTFGAQLPDIQLALYWPVMGFAFGLAFVAGILFGVSPAFHATRITVSEVLKDSASAVAATRSRLRSGLVVSQIALTFPLLLMSGTLLLELRADLKRLPTSTFTDRILRVSFTLRSGSAPVGPQRESALRRVEARIAALPEVAAVVPQQEYSGLAFVEVHPADRVPGVAYEDNLRILTQSAAPGYFELMGFPLLRGRGFTAADQNDQQALVIRGDLARRLWGSADPIGRRLVHMRGERPGSTAFVIVGVLDETKAGLSGDGAQHSFVARVDATSSILVRTRGPAEPSTTSIRSVAYDEAPLLPVTALTTLAALEAGQRANFRNAMRAATSAGLLALFLCAVGLYAIMSFAVGQRSREIGIRSALGAGSTQVVGMFFRWGARLGSMGVVIGLALGAGLLRIVALSQGNEIPPGAVVLAAMVGAVMLGISFLAVWISARRAAAVDPLTVLKTE
ncbi:MAG: ABC transporter permease [Gemmatimonadaceae bacterium]